MRHVTDLGLQVCFAMFSKIIGSLSFAEATETIDVDQGSTEWNGAVQHEAPPETQEEERLCEEILVDDLDKLNMYDLDMVREFRISFTCWFTRGLQSL